jgi:DNA-binding LytR/AlgR family response regulator
MHHALKNEVVNGKCVIGRGKTLERVWIREIIYLEGKVNYTIIYTKTNTIISSRHLLFWEMQLKENHFDFQRIHRMYLVNKSHIKTVSDSHITVSNNDNLKISRRNQKLIKP